MELMYREEGTPDRQLCLCCALMLLSRIFQGLSVCEAYADSALDKNP